MEFTDYASSAIKRFGLRGHNALARELGLDKSSISQFKSGKALPSEDTMIKLAELAGLPKEEALIDLNLWRSKDKPELQKIWLRLSKMIGCFAAPLLLFAPEGTLAALATIGVIGMTTHILCDKSLVANMDAPLLCCSFSIL